MQKFNKAKKILFFTLALFGMSMQLQAALITWSGGGVDPTDWNDGANWVGGIAPGVTDDAVISGGSATLSVVFTVASLEIQSGADIIIDATGVLNVGGDDGVDTNGAFDISSSSATVINNGTINVTNASEDGIDHRGMSFINNGTIVINGFDNDGISVEDASGNGGVFINNSSITIIMSVGGEDDGIQVDDNSSIVNAGTITISSVSCVGDVGILLDDGGMFTNTATGIVNISDTADEGIFIVNDNTDDVNGVDVFFPDAVLNNSGSITTTNVGQCFTSSNNNGIEVRGIFNNNAGGVFKDIGARGDAIRITSTSDGGVLNNAGTLVIDMASNTNEAIEVDSPGAFVDMGGMIEIGCLNTITEIELNNVDLGTSTIIIDSDGTGSCDLIQAKNGPNTISGVSIVMDFTSTPAIGSCCIIAEIDGGSLVGQFASVTSSDPSLTLDVIYTNPAQVEVCIIEELLPVELVSFTGKKSAEGNQLNWITSSELNNNHFEIEQSLDGRNFTKIGSVEGNGTTSARQDYKYIDKNPAQSENYYRLKQVDFDGAFEYSNIVFLENKGNDTPIAIYPNPAQEVLNYEGAAATLSFYDNAGRKITEKVTQGNTSLDISDLEAGFYMIEILNANNEKSYERFIISK